MDALRHTLTDDGRVALTLTRRDGIHFHALLTPSAAKVAAWAILSDLSPSDAAQAQAEEARSERKRFTHLDRALVAYARGAVLLQDMIAMTGMSNASAEQRTMELRKAGLLEVTFQGGGRLRPSRYAVTAAGEHRAAQLERAMA